MDYGLVQLKLSNPLPEHPKAQFAELGLAMFFRNPEPRIMPAFAALLGGVLSAVRSGAAAIRGALRNRGQWRDLDAG